MIVEVDIDDSLHAELSKRAKELELCLNDYLVFLLKRELSSVENNKSVTR